MSLTDLLFQSLTEDVDLGPEGPCKNYDPELFFPLNQSSYEQAKAICSTCPSQAECFLLGADTSERRSGVYGGQLFLRGRAQEGVITREPKY